MGEEQSEIVFFDVETTVPRRGGEGYALLEFGAIIVCPRKLVELRSFSSLVKPKNPGLISSLSVRCNGITPDAVSTAPSFAEIADTVYRILHGRIWAGHNILRFDCVRIREAFGEIGRAAPEPKGTFDTLSLLTHKFGRRAGDMKMATLATYFDLGKQTHRSLDDVRMNLEVLKYCATVLFLESSLPESFPEMSWVSPNVVTRSRSEGKSRLEGNRLEMSAPSSSNGGSNGNAHPILSLFTDSVNVDDGSNVVGSNAASQNPFNMGALRDQMNEDAFRVDIAVEERAVNETSDLVASPVSVFEGYVGFMDPDEVSVDSVEASFVPYFRGQRMLLLHRDVVLQLHCPGLRVRFGLSNKFTDHAGRPRLSFVVDALPSLCRVLDACDIVGKKTSQESGSISEWKPLVNRKYPNSRNVRLHIPTAVNGDIAQYATEIYQKEPSGNTQKLVFSKFDAAELDAWLSPGTIVDAFISLIPYDFHENAGIRLVLKKLIINIKSKEQNASEIVTI